MLLTLEAAEAQGGYRRGKQSAAIKVMPANINEAEEINCDLRADDHQIPLVEL